MTRAIVASPLSEVCVPMNIEIEYCVPCGYLDRAIEAQRRLLTEFGHRVTAVSLRTGDSGVFTFTVDGEVIYTKPAEYDLEDIVVTVRKAIESRGKTAA